MQCPNFYWFVGWNNNKMIDLAPKFALRIYRYITFMLMQTGKVDLDFIGKVYPSTVLAMDALESRWGEKDSHVPISKGIPDLDL